jgi:signal transduction histidine kinase
MTLKRRVALAMLAVVALFVVAQGLLAYLSLVDQEDDLVDELVLAQARELAARVERGELHAASPAAAFRPAPDLSAWLVDASGHAAPTPLPPHLASLRDGPHRLGRPLRELHVVALPTAAGRLVVQYDAERNEAKVRDFGLYLIALGVLCLALAALLAWQVAGWIVAPIERLTARLANWAPQAPRAEAAASDEESRLLDAFARVQDRFERAIAHEREFVANLGHEIRTPLAALRTDLELLESGAPADSPQRARLQRALASVDAVTASLEAARRLSARRRAPAQTIDLAACVDDAWASLQALRGAGALRFANEVPPGTRVAADRHALLTILRNLFRNAVEHAAPARCTVRFAAGRIEVIDDGPGIAPQDLPFVFDRYYRGRLLDSEGEAPDGERGLGLAIARQLADLHGWQLSVEPAAAREPAAKQGTRFILSLGAI